MSTNYNSSELNNTKTQQIDPHIITQVIKHLCPNKSSLYLDVGCGNGNYTHALQEKGYQCIGVDTSIETLEKAFSRNQNIKWKVGTAEKTNLPQHAVDGIISMHNIQHWSHLMRAFSELNYILKPNGKIVIFTVLPEQIKGYWLNHYFPKALENTIQQRPTLDAIVQAMQITGFKTITTEIYNLSPTSEDQFLYCGKYNPELYFDQNIRHGIASFDTSSSPSELKNGLATLRSAIDNGSFNNIKETYDNNLGDYIFISGEK